MIFQLPDSIHLGNVMSIYEKSLSYLKHHPILIFDFSQVISSDSSGLALMIEWIKYANLHNLPIQFTHLPEDLIAIARAARLEALLELDASNKKESAIL